MLDNKLLLQKAIITQALKNNDITPEQYREIIIHLDNLEEELRLKSKLKEYKDREIIKHYTDLLPT